MIGVTIGERIKAARKNAGMTQKQLGELAGIAEPTIRRYELGKLNPKFETLAKIAEALKVNPADLDERLTISLREEGQMKPWENNFGARDPTAYAATKAITDEEERVSNLVRAIKTLIHLSGFDLLNRIELRDKKSGRIYR